MRQSTDILISGGGIAGLMAAASFGSAGFRVICVDPTSPATEPTDPNADHRSTAFLQPAIPLFQAAGLWSRFAPFAAPLQVMRIIDAGGVDPTPRKIKDFDAHDVSKDPFGWNLPNWLLRRELLARLEELPNVAFRPGVSTRSVLTRESEVVVGLSDGGRVATPLLIAADGRNSPVREMVGIPVRTTRYGQKALAFAVTHPLPHHDVSTEIHRSGGPFTLVPLPDRDGIPSSSVVWMETGAEITRLANLPVSEFEAAMNARSCHILGPLTLRSRRMVWPIITQMAERLTAQRTALMAEAAHVLPPIGAQGLNMSMADLSTLLELATADRANIGSPTMLDEYARRRHADIRTRLAGVDVLNRASMVGGQMLRDLRGAGLEALYSVTPVRKALMRAGLGIKQAAPQAS